MKRNTNNDEINLLDVIINLLNHKFKILIITSVFTFLGYSYYFFLNKSFILETNIKPISTFEDQKYKTYNLLAGEDLYNINSNNLLNLFINKIQTGEIIEEGIIKFRLVKKDNFNNDKEYEEEVERVSVLILESITPPNTSKKNDNGNNLYWKFKYEVNNKNQWSKFLKFIENQANEEIRLFLINQFNMEINFSKLNAKHKLEDIDQKISNALDDYKISTSNKIAFLIEQAQIARTLNIEKNTLEVDNFQSDNTIITNLRAENSYYLKGYDMIEKEISLINSRKNEKAFISSLVELEKNKRSILQDKRIERLESVFFETPVNNKDDFISAKINYISTTFDPQQSSLIKILTVSFVIGFLISLLTIVTINETKNLK